ncbi:MAG: caspase family protein [Chlorobiales bacterium]|nr:caspase family protein [Chlorobiales bacterium]
MSTKLFLLLLFLCAGTEFTYAQQASQMEWEQTIGGSSDDLAKAITLTSDGGTAFAGSTDSKASGKSAAWVSKLSSSGQLDWDNVFSTSKWDEATAIAPASDGGIVIAGKTWGKSGGRWDTWIFKVNRSGAQEWEQFFGGKSDDVTKAIVATSDGGFAFLGNTESKPSGKSLAWIVKLSASGQLQWENTFNSDKWDEATAIAPTSDGGLIVAGKTWSRGAGRWDAWVFKLNRSGAREWEQLYGGKSDDLAKAIVTTPDGGFAFLGDTDSKASGKSAAWVVKLSSSGQLEWETAPATSRWDEGLSIAATSDGGVAVAGNIWSKGAGRSDAWVFKLNRSGAQEWEQIFGGKTDDVVRSVVATLDGGMCLAGETASKGSGEKDAWIIKLRGSGSIAYKPETWPKPQPIAPQKKLAQPMISPAVTEVKKPVQVVPQPAPKPVQVESVRDVDQEIPATGASNPDAVAIVIGNRNYFKADVPAVEFAQSDAQTMKLYLMKVLGYREGNILFYENATLADFNAAFGKDKEHFKGKLYNYVKPGKSDVFVYYSGHGAPDVDSKAGYFVPADCDPSLVSQNGYPLETLYHNLSKVPAKSMSVVIDACFSGASGGGMVIKNASPLFNQVKNPMLSLQNTTVFTSSSGDQVSSWYPEAKHSLFTYYFLKGMKGEADANKDGSLTAKEMEDYLKENVPYMARRLYGRDQTPQIFGQGLKTIVKY